MIRTVSLTARRVSKLGFVPQCGRYLSTRNVHDDMKPFYALGMNIGMRTGAQVKHLIGDDEKEALLAGFEDYMLSRVDMKDIEVLMEKYGVRLNEIVDGRNKDMAQKACKQGEDFIVQYLAKNPDAIRTPSGLVYHETATGTGNTPNATSTVTTHYHGTFIDGAVFDSSVNRGEPLSFSLEKVISGWQEGIQRMKVGGKAVLICPSHLAYGQEGSPPQIGPGTTLIFEVELLEVK